MSHASNKLRRSAFTLIELLVVIAIIAILIGLLIPAVQKVRETAARISSANNLKQMALATMSYHDANNGMPNYFTYSYTSSPYSYSETYFFVALLPYLEQGNLYTSMTTTNTNPTTTPKVFINPGDGTLAQAQAQYSGNPLGGYMPGLTDYFNYTYISSPYQYNYSQSYGISSGYSEYLNYGSGQTYTYSSGGPYTITQIFTDGTSNTLLFTEQVAGCSGQYPQAWYYQSGLSVYYENFNGSIYQGGPQGVKSGVTYATCGNYYSNYLMSTGSTGPQCALADGSVHIINPAISSATLMNLLVPNDGNVLGKDAF